MRYKKIYILFGLTCILSISCIKDDAFELPNLEVPPAELSGIPVTIPDVKDALLQEINNNGNSLLTFENDQYITGFVVSSDEQGNFFEELIIQNDSVNASAGVRVLIDANPLFQSFELGRKVYVQLNGLTVKIDNGQLTIGFRDGNTVGKIAESSRFDHVIRDPLVAGIEPTVRTFAELDDNLINTYIRLSDVQFNRNDVLGEQHLTYAGEPDDEFDGERTLESCLENSTIVFSTSTFADFKSLLLPAGRGYIDGIFTYNFFGDTYNLVVNDLLGVNLDSQDRCDPAEVDCGTANKVGTYILLSEFFETQTEGDPIDVNGWTNFIEAGTQTWEAYIDQGTNASLGISARMGSFMSGDDNSIGWLITPEIDFDKQDGETISFRTSNSFADGSTLEVLYSRDWDGDPAGIPSATWELLPSAVIVSDDDFFGDWIFSELVDLSCIEGTGHIAWKYVGSGDEAFDGTYELDEIEVRSN